MLKKQTKTLMKSGLKVKKRSSKKFVNKKEFDDRNVKKPARILTSTSDTSDDDTAEESLTVYPKTSRKNGFENESGSSKWYEEFPGPGTDNKPIEDATRDALRKEAGALFEQEIKANIGKAPRTIQRSDYNWIKTVISKGTVSDKIAAYVLLIQDNPIVNMSYLKNMISMAKVGKKRECFMTMDTLVELFLEDLLPPDRKLKFFAQQPHSMINSITEGGTESRRRLLILWFFEDQLKNLYTAFIRALNDAAHDSVEANKERVIVVMHKMLQGHPEQEGALLSNIVNKLGDPSHKIGSKVIYTLTKLLDTHPAMKGVVAEEVERVIFRPNMSKRAQYYSVCFLGLFTFDNGDSALASHLISIYFSLFKACIKMGEIDSRMMSALLTGVSRAYPFAKSECGTLTEHVNTVYKVVHLSSANVAIHALSLLYLVVGDYLTDRFMTVLYKKIGEPGMFNAAHHAMFLSLIFKAVKRDSNDGRVCAFIKRLLQVSVHLSVPLICGILMLISQVIHSRKKFVLRMEQEATASVKLDDDGDGEEHYKDLVNVDDSSNQITVIGATDIKEEDRKDNLKMGSRVSSWYHAAIKPTQNAPRTDGYNPHQRNPLHAQGDQAVPVELMQLSRHFHPTISLFATNIVQGSKINYSGDPLQDFTLIRFLDKFVFKNPKKFKSTDEQLTTFARFGRKKYYASVGLKRLRVNTEEYLKNDEKAIPVDENFMYKFLKERTIPKRKKVKKEEEDDEDSDASSVDDEEFDDILKKVSRGQKDDLDFMREIGSLPTGKSGVSQEASDDEGLSGDEGGESDDLDGLREDEDDLGDLPENEDDLSDLGSNAEDFDGDEVDDWSEDDELASDLDDALPSKGKKGNKSSKKRTNSSGLFASAEEFAELLEDDQYKAGSSGALSNKDNAAIKQLKWETNRDRWVTGKNNFKGYSKSRGQGGANDRKRRERRPGNNAPHKKRKR